jgi:hypothetical protein
LLKIFIQFIRLFVLLFSRSRLMPGRFAWSLHRLDLGFSPSFLCTTFIQGPPDRSLLLPQALQFNSKHKQVITLETVRSSSYNPDLDIE